VPADAHLPIPAPLSFGDAIRFESVCFRYGSDGPWVLDGLSLAIPKGARIGFVGTTGSGKSTTLDLLMGLLEPASGQILVDGAPVNGERRRAWQRTIAHVPQSIYLADTTVAENIAFGVPREAIDPERVRQAARQAQIAEFIESRPDGYQAFVGERGIRLSGGQRQRIGIARALYKQATVLVFDEATSALDNATEQAVMDAIENLDRELTILIIAHRLSTVQRCDTIIELEHGRVVAQGSYEQLLERSPSFRRMARAAA
jgi:ATP-binding cassette subfamily B protein